MDNEEEKKEDKGEHINLKVKDQVRRRRCFSLSRFSLVSLLLCFFRAVYALSFARERENEISLSFFFQNSIFFFFFSRISLSSSSSLSDATVSLRSRKTTGQRRGALQGEDGHQVQEGAQFLRALAGFLF